MNQPILHTNGAGRMVFAAWKRVALLLLPVLLGTTSCKKYLDIVPDNVPTIDNAFHMKAQAIEYLYTCYDYLPKDGSYGSNPAMGGVDEVYMDPKWGNVSQDPINIAIGQQRSDGPLMSIWDNMFKGLRDCNIFLDNVGEVADLEPEVEKRWVGEVKFLKAYYHWCLFREYGPIPIIDKNLPISATVEEAKVFRQPVDSVVNYISNLLDEAAAALPATVIDNELGRITRPIALSIKARLLVTAASPLFNGNTAYSSFTKSGTVAYFNPAYDGGKWTKALQACKAAIDACVAAGMQLYHFPKTEVFPVPSDTIITDMSIRGAVTQKWNTELIWGSSNSRGDYDLQRLCMPRLDPTRLGNQTSQGQLAPTLKMAEMYYTNNGVPINEDPSWNYSGRYSLRTADYSDTCYLQPDYTTVALHFDREPRFYANIGFDGGMWFMKDGHFKVQAKYGQWQSRKNVDGYSVTGYFTKKLVNYEYVIGEDQGITVKDYPWPIMRLSDLYLLYAEASNEVNGPGADAYQYIDMVRARAGVPSVEEAWSLHSNKPGKYTTQDGLRQIIQQERAIELMFEGSRFWDLRRWKLAQDKLTEPFRGWTVLQAAEADYYKVTLLHEQNFKFRDYFWPIKTDDLLKNPNLGQNPGW